MLRVDAASPRARTAIAQKRDEVRECLGCGASLEGAHGRRKRCEPCNKLTAAEKQPEYDKRYREKYADDPVWKERRNAKGQKYRRARGMRPQAERVALNRKRADRLLPKIKQLQERGFSYGEIATLTGLTRNTVAGLLWRAKRANASSNVPASNTMEAM